MNKQVKYTFRGANQDATKSKHPLQYYFEGQHIRLLATDSQSTASVANEKGNELSVTIPDISINTSTSIITYGTKTLSYKNGNEIDTQITDTDLPITSNSQIIIGHATTRNSIILFTTDDLGFDCIWLLGNVLEDQFELTLLYVRNLGFSTSNPIQAIFNYENDNIQKVYWVDGQQQIKTLNITNDSLEEFTPLIDLPSNTLNFVGDIVFSQPSILDTVGGGIHTSGKIQYAYNLYRLNSTQSKISPLSELVPLGKGDFNGGGELNEVVGTSPIVRIEDIDLSYTHIKVYAIKYTSLNEIPSINLIEERELNNNDTITVYDDGRTISSLTLEEFLFLGSDPVIPKHIESKDNRLFLANIQTSDFVLPDELDTRAYSFNSSGFCFIYDNVRPLNANGIPVGDALQVNSNYTVPEKFDSVNLNLEQFIYQSDGTTIGGEGKYIKYELIQKTAGELDKDPYEYTFLKDREVYRIGIEFYNTLGQTSLPKWIADFRAPSGNLAGNYNTLNVELKAEFYTWLNSFTFENEVDKPVGYKIVRADRKLTDRTIICQGMLSSMMVNTVRDSEGVPLFTLSQKRVDSQTATKIPNFLTRTFEEISPLKQTSHLEAMQFVGPGGGSTTNPLNEVQIDGGERKADTYQYTAMMQLFSPEILFENISVNNSTKFNIVGGIQNTYNAYWGKEIRVSNQVVQTEGKALNGLSPAAAGTTNQSINGSVLNLMNRGLISETNGSNPNLNVEFNQWYREFSTFFPATNLLDYFIFGTPEITERGEGVKTYNNNAKYQYSNTLEGFLSDGEDDFDDDGPTDRSIISLNSFGLKNVTFVVDDGSQIDIDPFNRIKLENLHDNANIGRDDVALVSELVIPRNDIYLSNIYGGNSFEDKKRSDYIKIGTYQTIDQTSVQIDNAGDTYVQPFRFLRINKTDTEIFTIGINQLSEVVSFNVETTVDLKNRNDLSLSSWDSRFQPRFDEFHSYNRVYSQQPTLVQTEDTDFTFQRVKNFDTRIQATKLKIPNESIDSWTDILVNEVEYLDGKYGPINNIVNYKDNMFAFQDEAIASVSINPRIQVQGSDGIGIELGTGNVLYDYNYITTKSGSINKWSVIRTKRGIYYYDALNKSIGRIPDSVDLFLTDKKGMHSFFNNNFDYNQLKVDNPILGSGAVFGYDNYNNDVYFSLLQGDKSFTWCYNELADEFIDLKKGYIPSRYISKGEKLMIPSTGNNDLYEQYAGEYNQFFGEYVPSYIILQLNPESDYDCIFNNIHFNSEIYLDDIDQPNETLTHIQAYNEYQDSGRIPLILGRSSNLRRKFREWRADIPREGRNRIRNPWIFLKLELDNTSNYKMILHDIIVKYTV